MLMLKNTWRGPKARTINIHDITGIYIWIGINSLHPKCTKKNENSLFAVYQQDIWNTFLSKLWVSSHANFWYNTIHNSFKGYHQR